MSVTQWYFSLSQPSLYCFEVCTVVMIYTLQSVDFVRVFQSFIILWLSLVAAALAASEDCCTQSVV